jgi:hypothetical protein
MAVWPGGCNISPAGFAVGLGMPVTRYPRRSVSTTPSRCNAAISSAE